MTDYRDLLSEARGVLSGETDPIANAANLCALIWAHMHDLNWAGFYFLRGTDLVLGPFQGKIACTRIGWGRGVCGGAVVQNRTLVVDDVHAFSGHIACDTASASEVVVPLLKDGRIVGVLDVDSPRPARFAAEDAAVLESLAALWGESSLG